MLNPLRPSALSAALRTLLLTTIGCAIRYPLFNFSNAILSESALADESKSTIRRGGDLQLSCQPSDHSA
jgi:hypothetical protein